MTQIERDPNQDGRSRRKNEAMRAVQSAALRLFSKRGFAEVTVEEIAAEAGVGPATVYRNFGSKERVLLWDEYDPVLFRRIGAAPACRDAALMPFATASSKPWTKSTARTPPASCGAPASFAARHRCWRRRLPTWPPCVRASQSYWPRPANDFRRRIMAAAVVGALNASIDRWIDERGKTPLRKILKKAFAELGSLAV